MLSSKLLLQKNGGFASHFEWILAIFFVTFRAILRRTLVHRPHSSINRLFRRVSGAALAQARYCTGVSDPFSPQGLCVRLSFEALSQGVNRQRFRT